MFVQTPAFREVFPLLHVMHVIQSINQTKYFVAQICSISQEGICSRTAEMLASRRGPIVFTTRDKCSKLRTRFQKSRARRTTISGSSTVPENNASSRVNMVAEASRLGSLRHLQLRQGSQEKSVAYLCTPK